MFSHVMMGARDLARMAAFRDAVLAPLGLSRRCEVQDDGGPPGTGRAAETRRPTFFVQEPFDGGCAGNGRTTAFLASSPAAVRAAHAAEPALAAGGADDGAPGECPRLGRACHGVCLRDSEGSRLHRGGLAAAAAG
jgi:catechol 2,3-dioxygenase-like lactoylglutathione lyase family enzyme